MDEFSWWSVTWLTLYNPAFCAGFGSWASKVPVSEISDEPNFVIGRNRPVGVRISTILI